MSPEIWRSIDGYTGVYSVSNLGRIRSEERRVVNRQDGSTRLVRERILKQRPDKDGYSMVWLYYKHIVWAAKVASLVAKAFIGGKPSWATDVCHNDGNKQNNVASNLRYDTRTGNMSDCVRHGTLARGEKANSKLTAERVLAIRADQRTLEAIGKDYGISFQHAGAIKQRKVWKHV